MYEITLPEHERKSQERAGSLHKDLVELEDAVHHEHHVTHHHHSKPETHETTNIFDTKGNENMDSIAAVLPAILSQSGNRHDGTGALGAGALGFVAGALVGKGGNGGLFGNNSGDGAGVDDIITMSKLGTIEGAIPLAASQTQNAILEQTNALTNIVNQANLANLSASASVKDAVQTSATALLLNANSNTQAIIAAVGAVGTKIDANTIAELTARLAASENQGRSREVEVNVTNTLTNQQVQAQLQGQVQGLVADMRCLANNHQQLQQGIVNLGTMTGNSQTAANTRVNG